MKRRLVILVIALLAVPITLLFALFAPVVPLQADVPGSGGFYITTTITEGNTTSTILEAVSPAGGQGFGSLTFCFNGDGALYIHGSYYPLTRPTLYTTGAFCPALNSP
jgi:hypothetical protein